MKYMIFQLAKNYLFSSKKTTFRSAVLWIAVFGIFLAVCLVILSFGILAGFHKTYSKAILDFNSHIIIFRKNSLSPDEQSKLQNIFSGFHKTVPFYYSPYLFYETLMPTEKGMIPVILKGIDHKVMTQMYPFDMTTFDLKQSDSKNIFFVGEEILTLQKDILKKHQIKLIKLKDKVGQLKTQYQVLQVSGSFRSGIHNFDARFILTDFVSLRENYFNHLDVDGYEIRLMDSDNIAKLADMLNKALDKSYVVQTWDQLNQNLLQALQKEKATYFAVSIFVLLIGCLNIIGFNFLFFIQRKKEFMILSMLGLSLKNLRYLLRVLSFVIGGLSACLGALLSYVILLYLQRGEGIPLDPQIYYVSKIPVHFEFHWLVFFIIAVFILCDFTSWIAGKLILRRYLTAEISE